MVIISDPSVVVVGFLETDKSQKLPRHHRLRSTALRTDTNNLWNQLGRRTMS